MSKSVWDRVFSNRAWGKYPSEDLVRFVARRFYSASDRAAVRILDVGCGPGPNLWYLAREGFSFVGIDFSAVAIEQARLRLDAEVPGWTPRGQLHVGNIGALPLPDGFADAAIDNESIASNGFQRAAEIYREIARVLKPGGAIYSRTFAAGCWGDGTGTAAEDGLRECSEGPISGKGPVRFTRKEDIPMLFRDFRMDSIELLSRTCDGITQNIREWIIVATKAA